MASGNLAWSSEDSRHCWDTLLALWFAKKFTNYLVSRGVTTEPTIVETVEFMILSSNW